MTPKTIHNLLQTQADFLAVAAGAAAAPLNPTYKVLQAIDVDEVACLIDFDVDFESTMTSLNYLNQVKRAYQQELLKE